MPGPSTSSISGRCRILSCNVSVKTSDPGINMNQLKSTQIRSFQCPLSFLWTLRPRPIAYSSCFHWFWLMWFCWLTKQDVGRSKVSVSMLSTYGVEDRNRKVDTSLGSGGPGSQHGWWRGSWDGRLCKNALTKTSVQYRRAETWFTICMSCLGVMNFSYL